MNKHIPLILFVILSMSKPVEANFFVNAYHWVMNIPRRPAVKKYTQMISNNPISGVILSAYFGASTPKTKLIVTGCVGGVIALLEFFERFSLKVEPVKLKVKAPVKVSGSGSSSAAQGYSPHQQMLNELHARFKK